MKGKSKTKRMLDLVREIHENQQWNRLHIEFENSPPSLENIIGVPQQGLFWVWTNYKPCDFGKWDKDFGVISMHRMVQIASRLGQENQCTINHDGFRVVFVGHYFPEKEKSLYLDSSLVPQNLKETIFAQFDLQKISGPTLSILNSPQNDLSRWKVSISEVTEKQEAQIRKTNFDLPSLSFEWQTEFGIPVFNNWMFEYRED